MYTRNLRNYTCGKTSLDCACWKGRFSELITVETEHGVNNNNNNNNNNLKKKNISWTDRAAAAPGRGEHCKNQACWANWGICIPALTVLQRNPQAASRTKNPNKNRMVWSLDIPAQMNLLSPASLKTSEGLKAQTFNASDTRCKLKSA